MLASDVSVELLPGIFATRVAASSKSSQIVGVSVCGPHVNGSSRFDLGKRIFLDAIDGFDHRKVIREVRETLAVTISQAIDMADKGRTGEATAEYPD